MEKILVICGQTGTGKTSLAFYLADLLNGELISADSRQVYKKLDIGTGKDLLKDSRYDKHGYYDVGGIRIWGYDLIGPKENFSISQYLRFTKKAIKDVLRRGKLPILIGGTGLYIKGVIDGIPTAMVPKNNALRKNLLGKTPAELFESLAQLDPIKAGSLNHSDRNNLRRLIRAVEVATWKLDNAQKVKKKERKQDKLESLFIGLYAPKGFLERKINERVDKRMNQGLEEEVKKIISSGVSWKDQSMSSLGYRQWQGYFEGKKSKKEVIENWKKEEKNYAKRQITWFKKDKRIKWFDVSNPDYVKNVEKLVKKWYKSDKKD